MVISRHFQKFLKFKWKDKLYCFACFPNGLGSCPRKSTKLNKLPITTLHFENVPLSGYGDDFFTKGDTLSICEENRQNNMFVRQVGFCHKFKKVPNCSGTKN